MSEDFFKNCPFCGGNADILATWGKGRFGYCYWLRVECDICGCRTRGFAGGTEEPFDEPASKAAMRAALEVWDNRAGSGASNG